ncbi:hypothetical protein [Nocardioides psychrotolerans]|uniref:Uncharacterized protein n=1 Tax=Nocardioides psychrotolerans TaxID=1005945 RepID=A0A1I3RQI1_9ACTN|nr:hypothetical protein [Nocardioides psychrotolerans]SFJ48844.1 hypothetical protein SAMN05216561_1363 [Nocardioides psychrotolerans]
MRPTLRWRRERPDLQVHPGEQVLAWAVDATGEVVGGTRDALYVPAADDARIPWEEVEAADWDLDTSTLTVREVGSWGLTRPQHRITIAEPGRLLELVRERVTASIVLQRHVAVTGRRGVRVIARRAPRGRADIAWFFEYDEGIDPEDSSVRASAEAALAAAKSEVQPG